MLKKRFRKIILAFISFVLLIVIYVILNFFLFLSSYNINDLANEIQYACNISLLPSDKFVHQENTTLGYKYGVAFEYYRTFNKNDKDYKITYYDYRFNPFYIPYLSYPYAKIEVNDEKIKFSACIYREYYEISVSGYKDNGYGRTWLYINNDYSYSSNDERYYYDMLEYINEEEIKNTIEIFYNEANNDMKSIYNNIK